MTKLRHFGDIFFSVAALKVEIEFQGLKTNRSNEAASDESFIRRRGDDRVRRSVALSRSRLHKLMSSSLIPTLVLRYCSPLV